MKPHDHLQYSLCEGKRSPGGVYGRSEKGIVESTVEEIVSIFVICPIVMSIGSFAGALIGATLGEHENWDDIYGGGIGMLIGLFGALIILAFRHTRHQR